jgi:biopolymer transport protein ExbB
MVTPTVLRTRRDVPRSIIGLGVFILCVWKGEKAMMNVFLRGGPVMYPLLACSIIALTVIIERLLFWIREDVRRNQPLVDRVLELCQKGDWGAVKERVAGSRDYVTRILVSGIVHKEFSMAKAMESASAEEIKRMRRFMGALDTMITVAPLLGIFGTVLGIINSFDLLGISGIEDPKAVTAGIAQALITTATGLGIAILSVFPYNYFNSRMENAALTIERYATSLEIVYEKLFHEENQQKEGPA